MSGSKEREAIDKVLVVRLDPLGQAGCRIAGHDQTDQDAVDIDYLAYMTGSTITQVTEEARKLQDLDLVQMTAE